MPTVFPVIVLDSSFLISLYFPDDENHPKAIRLADENKSEEMLLPVPILFETMTVANYKGGMTFARELYDDLLSNRGLTTFRFSEDDEEELLREFFAHGGKLSVQDASVVYLARKTGSKVLAFDETIIKAVKNAK